MKILFKKFIVYTISFTLFIHGVIPAWAVIRGIDDPMMAEYQTKWARPLPASPDFRATPEKTAAGVMVVARHEGLLLTLLGLRDDTGTWCNFGGKSDPDHQTLLQTAVGECAEESVGMYVFHPEELRKSPSHTLSSEGNPTYRMYLKEVLYQPTETFQKLLEGAEDAHQKEFSEYRWVSVNTLMDHIENPSVSITPSAMAAGGAGGEALDAQSMPLFEPMVNLLKEPMVKAHLLRSLAGKDLRSIHTYNPGENAGNLSTAIYIAKYGFHPTFKEGMRKIDEVSSLFEEDPWRSKLTFASTVVNKMVMQEELLQKRPFDPDTPVEEAAAALRAEEFSTLSLGHDCPTLRHLKLTLGDRFAEDNLYANMTTYLSPLNGLGHMETRQKLEYVDKDIDRIVSLIQEEQRQWETGKFVLYHGADGNMGDLYSAFSAIRSLLIGKSYIKQGVGLDLKAVRGSDIYFSRLLRTLQESGERPSIDIIQEHFKGTSDYTAEVVTNRICTNLCLTTGPGLGQSTSNSLEYWMVAHSAASVSPHQLFSGAMSLLGVPLAYDPVRSLFYQTYGGNTANNGLLAQIFLGPETIKEYTHAHHAFLGETWSQDLKRSDIIAHFKELYGEPKKAIVAASSSTAFSLIDTRTAPEVWLYPVPGLMDHAMAKIHRRHEASPEDLTTLTRQLERLCCYGLSEWLVKEHSLVPGSFHIFQEGRVFPHIPKLQSLYQLAQGLVFGHTPDFSPSPTALTEIVQSNDPHVLDAFLASDPAIKESFLAQAKNYAYMAVREESFVMVDHILKTYLPDFMIYGEDPEKSLLTIEGLNRVFTRLSFDDCDCDRLAFMMGHLALDHIELTTKEHWARMVLEPREASYQTLRLVMNFFGKDARDPFLNFINKIFISMSPTKTIPLLPSTVDAISINSMLEDGEIRDEILRAYKSSQRQEDFISLLFDLGIDFNKNIGDYPVGAYFLLFRKEHYDGKEKDKIDHWVESHSPNPGFLISIAKLKVSLRLHTHYPCLKKIENLCLYYNFHMGKPGVQDLALRFMELRYIKQTNPLTFNIKKMLNVAEELIEKKQGDMTFWSQTLHYYFKLPGEEAEKATHLWATVTEQEKQRKNLKIFSDSLGTTEIDEVFLEGLEELSPHDQGQLFSNALIKKLPLEQLDRLALKLMPTLTAAILGGWAFPTKDSVMCLTNNIPHYYLKHAPIEFLEALHYAGSLPTATQDKVSSYGPYDGRLLFNNEKESEDYYVKILQEGSASLKKCAFEYIFQGVGHIFSTECDTWDLSWIGKYPTLIEQIIDLRKDNPVELISDFSRLCVAVPNLVSIVKDHEKIKEIILDNAKIMTLTWNKPQEIVYYKKYMTFFSSHGFPQYEETFKAFNTSAVVREPVTFTASALESDLTHLPPAIDWALPFPTDAMLLAMPDADARSLLNPVFRSLQGFH